MILTQDQSNDELKEILDKVIINVKDASVTINAAHKENAGVDRGAAGTPYSLGPSSNSSRLQSEISAQPNKLVSIRTTHYQLSHRPVSTPLMIPQPL